MASSATEAAGAPRRVSRGAKARANRDGIPLFQWITGNWFWDGFILACIVVNAVIIGYDAHHGPSNAYHALIERWNMYFLWIFTFELVFEFFAQGPKRYFRNGWNIFDVLVVGLSYIAVNPAIAALRTLRVVRVFRLISAVPQMRRVVEALFGAMPGILATLAILAIVFYIGAVMGTTLFHDQEGFRDLGESLLPLFALSQFDGWGEIVWRLQPDYPFAWVYVLSFTVIAAFAVLNLFIGVIVEAVQAAPQEEIMEEIDELEEDVEDIAEAQEDAAVVQQKILEEVRALRAEVAALRSGGAPPS
jgi:voltage-gated sodium channel